MKNYFSSSYISSFQIIFCKIAIKIKKKLFLLCSYLDDIGKSGECACEFLTVYRRLITPVHWKYYLTIKGILFHLGDLLTKVINHFLNIFFLINDNGFFFVYLWLISFNIHFPLLLHIEKIWNIFLKEIWWSFICYVILSFYFPITYTNNSCFNSNVLIF